MDYDPVLHQLNASSLFAGYRFGDFYLNGGQTYVNAPGEPLSSTAQMVPNIYNQWRMGLIYGGMTRKGFSGAFSVGVDPNPICCRPRPSRPTTTGTAAASPFNTPAGLCPLNTENAYRFSFSLTNIGTFGSIKRLERLY